MTSNRVLIIGGGSAGFLTAQVLKKLGIPYSIFEQDTALDSRPRDWDFGIYWAQTPLSDCLPPEITEERVRATQVDDLTISSDDTLPIYDLSTGETLLVIPTPFAMRIHRRKFLRLISEGLDVKVVLIEWEKYGKRLIGIETNGKVVTATFADGTQEQGGLLIGAEGAHSRVRDLLLGPEQAALKRNPLVLTYVVTKLPEEAIAKMRKLHKRMTSCFHPEGIFAWFGAHERSEATPPSEWTFTLMMSWNEYEGFYTTTTEISNIGSKPEILRRAKAQAQKFAEPFRSIWNAVPDNALVWHNRLSSWPTEEWDNRNGTVTLIGDAAHPMLPHRGQGLNNAIHDVASLHSAFREYYKPDNSEPFKHALEVYESDLWKRGREAVIMSDENSEAVHNWDKLKKSPLFTLGIKPRAMNGN
ncbi:hypothetical protein VNI00_004199 [Paramarasmius palmivorus]|uniref:FAD-binding domain-containing protein n=1 Tax=Paramarasmius palmivorus TaxID=297713 RepID=A0AAW0DPR5_9AGAR